MVRIFGWKTIALLQLCAILTGCSQKLNEENDQTDSGNENPQAVALIDKLVDVSNQGPGSHSTVWVRGFIAIDDDLKFGGGVLGSPKPDIDPTMRELVRMGTAALPDLLNHLSDTRETKLAVEPNKGKLSFTAKWHSDEHDPRYGNPEKQPKGVNTDRDPLADRRSVGEYKLKVGDLCFVAVGQIVNRGLNAIRYQPSACLVVNSPVETPALAAATREDWSGLTPKQHKESLIEDAQDRSPFSPPAALKRLLFYYPEDGEELAVKLLNRPWYDDHKLWDFIMTRLVAEQDCEKWQGLIDRFREENGQPAADSIPFRLHWIYWLTSAYQDARFLAEKEVAARILKELYPKYDPHQPPFINASETREQTDLVEGLSGFRSAKIDAEILRVFRSINLEKYEGFRRIEADDLARACMDRLIGMGFDEEFESYCEKRIKELKGKKREVAEDQRLEFLSERLKRIRDRGDKTPIAK